MTEENLRLVSWVATLLYLKQTREIFLFVFMWATSVQYLNNDA